MSRNFCWVTTTALVLGTVSHRATAGDWVQFVDETATRLIAPVRACSAGGNNGAPCLTDADCPDGVCDSLGELDPEEKDLAWADLDKDGDIDLVVVRKQFLSTPGRRRNVLFMNENGILVDRTVEYASAADDGGSGFLDPTNDRDVALIDVNGDTWLDMVTATTYGTTEDPGLPKTLTHPRVYINLGDDVLGDWQGFRYEEPRIPALVQTPNFCGVGHGDLTLDGRPDFYFVDYFNTLEDRLLINDGTGNYFDDTAARTFPDMVTSTFATHAVVADMNGDNVNDIIKDSALGPYQISVLYNDVATPGVFEAADMQIAYTGSSYFVSVGDLNNDDQLDLIVTDDGQDVYLLNQGNDANGHAILFQCAGCTLPDSGGFGGNSIAADLDLDGWDDVMVADVDVDLGGCGGSANIYRNQANGPDVTFLKDSANIPQDMLTGTHDIAVFDINGDDYLDMIIARCSGTQVWINQPPISLDFAYPDGIPSSLTPGNPASFRVDVTAIGSDPASNSGTQFVSVDGGPFIETPMVEEAPNTYRVELPGVPCTSTVEFYVTVENTMGQAFADPSTAPSNAHTAFAALGTVVALDDSFETDLPGWTVSSEDGLTSGGWERVDPIGTFFPDGSTNPAQPEDDFGLAVKEQDCYVTAQHPGAGGASASDVDDGTAILTSPVLDLSGTDAIVSYARWHFSNTGGTSIPDALVTEVSNNGTTWVQVAETFDTAGQWEIHTFKVSDVVIPSGTTQVRFKSSDVPNNSVTESAIDDFQVTRFLCDDSCLLAGDCQDALFCNGAEICDSGTCAAGIEPCAQLCDEANNTCVDCLGDADCDDHQFCNGVETCQADSCQAGTAPCVGALVCDEISNVCAGCLVNGDCDDGLFCNGQEFCSGSNCVPAGVGVGNGDFNTADDWTINVPDGGSIIFNGTMEVTGDNDGGGGGLAWGSQANIIFSGAILEFDLVSYSSTDIGTFDYPVILIDGTRYGLNDDGSLGSVDAAGSIDNGNPVTDVHFAIDVEALVGAGPHEIGLGVFSSDSIAGAGIAAFDNVAPAAGPADPCPGAMCSEGTDTCVECLADADCQDGSFCNGAEVCMNGTCDPGGDPCPDEICDEAGDTCIACLTNGDCDDGLFCNGVETCVAGDCVAGSYPCVTTHCLESTDSCELAVQSKMGESVHGLSPEEVARFLTGRAQFETLFDIDDGLGPIFNKDSCAGCHSNPIGGSGTIVVTRFGFADKGNFDPLGHLGGSLLQSEAIDDACLETVPLESNVQAHRLTNSTMGDGLIEAIPDSNLLAGEGSGPGVSGKAHVMTAPEDPGAGMRVGRFGWKAQLPTLLGFSADAALNEMGLTNRVFPDENAPNGDSVLLAACDALPDPEDNGPMPQFIDDVTDFQRLLAAPPQTPRAGMSGALLFAAIGCADCHTPTHFTGQSPIASLAHQVIRPHSDFLLHDMGTLGDGIEQGQAGTTEMRTPPLWGVRQRDPMLHDGRIGGGTFTERIENVIAEHAAGGSEGAPSAASYAALLRAEKDAVIQYLDSLGRAEFDHDGNNRVLNTDFLEFAMCFDGGPYTPDDACAISDIDADGDVDLDDYDFFEIAYDLPLPDCNMNLVIDFREILVNNAPDENANAILDECESLCSTVADCCDLNSDNIRDDNCIWCACNADSCNEMPLTAFADMGGSFGACLIDGFANIHDRNQVLSCFAGIAACDLLNIDAGGAFGSCIPDGFCNIHDANHALTSFAGTTTCSCPGGPAPQSPPLPAGETTVVMAAAEDSLRGGDIIEVQVYLEGPVLALQSYQLGVYVSGGQRGHLELVDIRLTDRPGSAFFNRFEPFFAKNVATRQMLAGLNIGRVNVEARAGLATFIFKASPDAQGEFVVDLDRDGSYVIADFVHPIEIRKVKPAIVGVGTRPAGSRPRG
jgi:hypothetical protein